LLKIINQRCSRIVPVRIRDPLSKGIPRGMSQPAVQLVMP
jgi:hypothetical protein